MKVSIEINCDNEAFNDPLEIKRILHTLGSVITLGKLLNPTFPVIDSNGNIVGHVTIER